MTAPAKIRYPAGPEDEFDVTFDDIKTRSRGDRPDLVYQLRSLEQVPGWLTEEARYLRKFHRMSIQDLAARLNITAYAVEDHIPYDVSREVGPNDRKFDEVLEVVIAAGRRFTAAQLPLPDNDHYSTRALDVAVKAGRIRRVGRTNKMIIWEPIPTTAYEGFVS